MFFNSPFNGVLSRWNVSNVTNMTAMFAESKFNGDLSQWNIANVKYMKNMFKDCNAPVPSWYVELKEKEEKAK